MRTSLLTAFAVFISTALVVIAIDLASYWFLPTRFAMGFLEYRASAEGRFGGRGTYPQDYFISDAERGFDIGANRAGEHWIQGLKYSIWSNGIGCFDVEHAIGDPYVYFAGDSFTWGYAPFEHKFGTIIEQATEVPILKCGVTHTGQRHQYEKLLKIERQLGYPPKDVFVFRSHNDTINDHFHPHTTVVNGWLVDNKMLSPDHGVMCLGRARLSELVRKKLGVEPFASGATGTPTERLKTLLWRYSLSANLLRHASRQTLGRLRADSRRVLGGSGQLRSIYSLSKVEGNGSYPYRDNDLASENKTALLAFRSWALANGAALHVVLIPPRSRALDTDYYAELRAFLRESEIDNLDLSFSFARRGLSADDLYWRDGHLNLAGNVAVADTLLKHYGEVFSKNGRPRNHGGY